MTVALRPIVRAATAALLLATTAFAQDGLPEGPDWGRPRRIRPEGKNVLFATGDGCGGCHSASSNAVALRDVTGADVSPHGLWRATAMANSFRDPYWRSQVAREIAAAPEKAEEIQNLCVTCHAPMAHHTARIAGRPHGSVRELTADPLARDGVSCTVCHQARPDNFGKPESFRGNLDIRPGRIIYGPYPDPMAGPMRMHSAYTATEGPHVQESALCGSCHTLVTRPAPDAPDFPEQTPYLEWRNSVFSTEGRREPESRNCQECHMADLGEIAIARNPAGVDFAIDPRPNYRAHAFVGGNAFLLEMLRDAAEELGVTAPPEAFDRLISATRRQLRRDTADVEIDGLSRQDDRIRFSVKVTNRTGHKLPTGYPARRIWLTTEVIVGEYQVFESGGLDDGGRITDLAADAAAKHVDRVRSPADVPVWSAVPVDLEGRPTTILHGMARYAKDDRLLPRGWKPDGPDVAMTAPVGVDGDADFIGGSDTVHFDLPVPADIRGEITVKVMLLYQSIPPEWAAPHAEGKAPENEVFTRLYRASNTLAEILGTATAVR
ncbi:MAG: multiheme c-type cytochrome [Planctomycetota bacterium]